MRPKGVVDGKQVNIPVLIIEWYRGTKKGTVGQYWMLAETFKVLRDRKKTILELRRDTVLLFLAFFIRNRNSTNYRCQTS